MKNAQWFAKGPCKIEGGKWAVFGKFPNGRCSSGHPLWFLGFSLGCRQMCCMYSEKHQGKQMHRLMQKSRSSLSSFAGCLLDYLKTEEGSQLNLPKLIDMSAQVSEQPLKTRICYCLSEILASLKSVRASISERKTAPPGVLSWGFPLGFLVLMCMSAQQWAAVLRAASGELSALLENWGLVWGFGVCFVFFSWLAEQEIILFLFLLKGRKSSTETSSVETGWLSAVIPF